MKPELKPFTVKNPSHNFDRLIAWSVPYKHEIDYYGPLLDRYKWTLHDGIGYYLEIPGRSELVITAHLDVATAKPFQPKVKRQRGLLESENGPMGADDRGGVALILYMAHVAKVPARYWLFVGEERGRLGSRKLASESDMDALAVVSLDRAGYQDIITHQLSGRSCSDYSADVLQELLAEQGMVYKLDPTGIYTDSASFIGQAECTNLSIGYFGNHYAGEQQDTWFLDRLGEALAGLQWDVYLANCDLMPDPDIDKGEDWHMADTYYTDDSWYELWNETDPGNPLYIGTVEGKGRPLEYLYREVNKLYPGKNIGIYAVNL